MIFEEKKELNKKINRDIGSALQKEEFQLQLKKDKIFYNNYKDFIFSEFLLYDSFETIKMIYGEKGLLALIEIMVQKNIPVSEDILKLLYSHKKEPEKKLDFIILCNWLYIILFIFSIIKVIEWK